MKYAQINTSPLQILEATGIIIEGNIMDQSNFEESSQWQHTNYGRHGDNI